MKHDMSLPAKVHPQGYARNCGIKSEHLRGWPEGQKQNSEFKSPPTPPVKQPAGDTAEEQTGRKQMKGRE